MVEGLIHITTSFFSLQLLQHNIYNGHIAKENLFIQYKIFMESLQKSEVKRRGKPQATGDSKLIIPNALLDKIICWKKALSLNLHQCRDIGHRICVRYRKICGMKYRQDYVIVRIFLRGFRWKRSTGFLYSNFHEFQKQQEPINVFQTKTI